MKILECKFHLNPVNCIQIAALKSFQQFPYRFILLIFLFPYRWQQQARPSWSRDAIPASAAPSRGSWTNRVSPFSQDSKVRPIILRRKNWKRSVRGDCTFCSWTWRRKIRYWRRRCTPSSIYQMARPVCGPSSTHSHGWRWGRSSGFRPK